VEDTNGCKAKSKVTIQVIPDYELYIPNAFTPNGDGSNDFFEIFGNKKTWVEMNIKIFNRWGELVFESSDHNFKWNGTYKGVKLTPGVLVYEMTLTYINGYSLPLQTGSIAIIR
jgi:gliding motility-associated-like protein